MKTICMIVQSLYPQDERVRREAEALERTGVAVDVICLQGGKQEKEEEFGLVHAYRIMREGPKQSLAQYIWLSVRFAVASFRKLQSLAPARDYKLVQVHNMPDFLVFAGLFQKMRGRPLVLDLHDLSVELFGSRWSKRKAGFLIPLVRAVEKISCAFSNRLITASHGFKESLIRRGVRADKITLVLNTADPHIFKFDESRSFHRIVRGARLLYHGTVAERFGLTKAIDAVGHLQHLVPGSILNVYGQYSPEYRFTLQKRIRDLGLTDKVFLNGFKPLEEVHKIICDSDIGVVPYLSDPFMNLALSTKTFEYTATGLPVVASRLRSLTSIFDDHCITFADPASSEDLAQKIAGLCLNPRRRRTQVRHALHALPAISGEVMMGRYVELIEGLIGKEVVLEQQGGEVRGRGEEQGREGEDEVGEMDEFECNELVGLGIGGPGDKACSPVMTEGNS